MKEVKRSTDNTKKAEQEANRERVEAAQKERGKIERIKLQDQQAERKRLAMEKLHQEQQKRAEQNPKESPDDRTKREASETKRLEKQQEDLRKRETRRLERELKEKRDLRQQQDERRLTEEKQREDSQIKRAEQNRGESPGKRAESEKQEKREREQSERREQQREERENSRLERQHKERAEQEEKQAERRESERDKLEKDQRERAEKNPDKKPEDKEPREEQEKREREQSEQRAQEREERENARLERQHTERAEQEEKQAERREAERDKLEKDQRERVEKNPDKNPEKQVEREEQEKREREQSERREQEREERENARLERQHTERAEQEEKQAERRESERDKLEKDQRERAEKNPDKNPEEKDQREKQEKQEREQSEQELRVQDQEEVDQLESRHKQEAEAEDKAEESDDGESENLDDSATREEKTDSENRNLEKQEAEDSADEQSEDSRKEHAQGDAATTEKAETLNKETANKVEGEAATPIGTDAADQLKNSAQATDRPANKESTDANNQEDGLSSQPEILLPGKGSQQESRNEGSESKSAEKIDESSEQEKPVRPVIRQGSSGQAPASGSTGIFGEATGGVFGKPTGGVFGHPTGGVFGKPKGGNFEKSKLETNPSNEKRTDNLIQNDTSTVQPDSPSYLAKTNQDNPTASDSVAGVNDSVEATENQVRSPENLALTEDGKPEGNPTDGGATAETSSSPEVSSEGIANFQSLESEPPSDGNATQDTSNDTDMNADGQGNPTGKSPESGDDSFADNGIQPETTTNDSFDGTVEAYLSPKDDRGASVIDEEALKDAQEKLDQGATFKDAVNKLHPEAEESFKESSRLLGVNDSGLTTASSALDSAAREPKAEYPDKLLSRALLASGKKTLSKTELSLQFHNESVQGNFKPKENKITIFHGDSVKDDHRTLNHEVIHAMLNEKEDAFLNGDHDGLTPRDKESFSDLEKIRSAALNNLIDQGKLNQDFERIALLPETTLEERATKKNEWENAYSEINDRLKAPNLSDLQREELTEQADNARDAYGLFSLKEFTKEGLTNPKFQNLLHGISAKGLDLSDVECKPQTLWEKTKIRFRTLVFGQTLQEDSLLAKTFDRTVDLIPGENNSVEWKNLRENIFAKESYLKKNWEENLEEIKKLPVCFESADVVQASIVAEAIYDEPKDREKLQRLLEVNGLEKLSVELPPYLKNVIDRDKYVFELFENKEGKVFLVFRGTATISDVTTDILNAFGEDTKHYQVADQITEWAKGVYKDKLIVTGHSLGGGLAQYVGLIHSVKAIGLNSAGLSIKTETMHSNSELNNIVNINTKGDALSHLGLDKIGKTRELVDKLARQIGTRINLSPPTIQKTPQTLRLTDVRLHNIGILRSIISDFSK